VIRPIRLAELRRRGGGLFALAAAETGVRGEVHWPLLERLEASDMLLLLAIEEAGGQLLGYSCTVISDELFSRLISATTLSVFVRREHRGRWGRVLLRSLIADAQKNGADFVRVQAVAGSRLERLLPRLLPGEGLRRESSAWVTASL
jgi:GNAT superfamily N-acetyltransferase